MLTRLRCLSHFISVSRKQKSTFTWLINAGYGHTDLIWTQTHTLTHPYMNSCHNETESSEMNYPLTPPFVSWKNKHCWTMKTTLLCIFDRPDQLHWPKQGCEFEVSVSVTNGKWRKVSGNLFLNILFWFVIMPDLIIKKKDTTCLQAAKILNEKVYIYL